MIGLIFGIIFIISGIIGGIALIRQDYKGGGISVMLGGIVLGLTLCILMCFTSIPTGHTGIVTVFGKVENTTLDSGIHTKAPWQSIVKMDNRVQKETVELNCFSSDLQEVSVKYTLNYQINKQTASEIYKTIGSKYEDIAVTPTIAESVKTVVAKFTAEELIANRAALASAIEENLSAALNSYYIELVSTAIEDMDFSDAFTNAVEAKQVAQQNKLKAETEQAQKTMEAQQAAERTKIEAQAAAEVAKIQAQADLDVQKINADAAAYVGKREASVYMNKLGGLNGWTTIETVDANGESTYKFLDSCGNPVSAVQVQAGVQALLKQGYIDKWNGELPQYMLSDSSSILLDINNN